MELQPKLSVLAAALRNERDRILTDWLGTLRIGFEKPGTPMTDAQLRNHFADLLEDLCHQLELPLTEASEITALRHAENHGDMRWMNGYKLPELIREVAALRTVVVAAVVAHGHTRLDLREQSLANIIVHRFFDALVVESASYFATLAQDAAVLLERQRLAQELHDGAVAVGREERMIELKKEINQLCTRLGEPLRYHPEVGEGDGDPAES